MSLENKIESLTAVLSQILAALQQGAIVASAGAVAPAAPVYQAPAAPAAPVYQAPVAQASIPASPAMPAPPSFAAPAAQALPFSDNVTAATWAKDVWGKAAAVNQDQAMQKFGALMQAMGAVDFDSLTPAHFPTLFAGIQQIKAEMGIPG